MAKPRAHHPTHPRLFGWRTVVVCVVVGVVVNVGVAWGLAVWHQVDPAPTWTSERAMLYMRSDLRGMDYGGGEETEVILPSLAWPPVDFEFAGDEPDGIWEEQLPWYRGGTMIVWKQGNPPWYYYDVVSYRFGLPMRSQAWYTESDRTWEVTGDRSRFNIGIASSPEWEWGAVHLPLRPILPGFIVNTLFYAALVFAPVVGARVVRRRRRAKRGLCIACGYELADLTACPECGVASSPRRGAGV